jgi:hypothetical protein
MIRRGFSILALLSVALFVSLAALWAGLFSNSVYRPEGQQLWSAERRGETHAVTYDAGTLRYEVFVVPQVPRPPTNNQVVMTSSVIRRTFAASLPIPLALAVLAVPPVAWSWQRNRTRKRTMRQLCPECGYDLRATPERCPECGAVVANGEVRR